VAPLKNDIFTNATPVFYYKLKAM